MCVQCDGAKLMIYGHTGSHQDKETANLFLLKLFFVILFLDFPYDHSILTSWYNFIILYLEFPSLSSVSTGLEIGSIGIKPFEEIFMLNFNMHKNYLISANGLQ